MRIVSDRHAPDVARIPPPAQPATTAQVAAVATEVPTATAVPTPGSQSSKSSSPNSHLKRTESPPAPIAALAANIADLLARGPDDALTVEQTLADLVRAARRDRAELRVALKPIAEGGFPPGLRHDLPLATPLRQLHELTLNLALGPDRVRPHSRRIELSGLFQRLSLPLDRPPGMDPYALRGPADILTLRLAELVARIGDPGAVELVSTPIEAAGWIDPGVLCARIAEAEEAGWQPWPLDLDQALLRLPDSPDLAAVRAAHRLASPAGHRLAGWLRGGRPTLPAAKSPNETQARIGIRTQARAQAEAEALRQSELRWALGQLIEPLAALPSPVAAPQIPTTLIHLLRRGWYAPLPVADGSSWTVCWSALLPGHTDLIEIALASQSPMCPPSTLVSIARAVTSRSAAERSGAAQALAVLAASGQLDGDEFGRALVHYATRLDRQVLRSAVPVLRQALESTSTASASGARAVEPGAIGAAIVHWLPAILPPTVPQPLPYTSHLLSLAADAFDTAHAEAPAADASTATATALATLATRSTTRSAVSDAAQRLLAAMGVGPTMGVGMAV